MALAKTKSIIKMKVNCDLAELDTGVEELVMPYIDMANICCGAHAGNEILIKKTLQLAKCYQVMVGAHPSYPDRDNFGRQTMMMSSNALIETLKDQVSYLEGLAKHEQVEVDYVKPHGALYNDMMNNTDIYISVLKALSTAKTKRSLMIQATKDNRQHIELARQFNIELLFEAFADRRYCQDGRLLSRKVTGAVLDQNESLTQVKMLVEHQRINTASDTILPLSADSICVHGDNEESVEVIKQIVQLCRSNVRGKGRSKGRGKVCRGKN